MSKRTGIFLGILLELYIHVAFAAFLFGEDFANQTLAFLSLLSYLLTLTPSLLKAVLKLKNNLINWLLKYRRELGVAAYGFAFNHGVFIIKSHQINFLDFQSCQHYYHGFLMMLILTILTFTSNDWSVKTLKSNWKKLHKLTYILVFLVLWHILDKMHGDWSYFTPISIALTSAIIALIIIKHAIELKESKLISNIQKEQLEDSNVLQLLGLPNTQAYLSVISLFWAIYLKIAIRFRFR